LPKNSGSPLSRKEAEIIAKKLKAKIDESGRHIRAVIWYKGHLIGQFGYCHDRKKGNGNIPKDLGMSPHVTLEMAQCKYDLDYYLNLLEKRGDLPE